MKPYRVIDSAKSALSAPWTSLSSEEKTKLDGHQLFFFFGKMSVNLSDGSIGKLLDFSLGTTLLVFGKAIVFYGLLDGSVGIAASVAYRLSSA